MTRIFNAPKLRLPSFALMTAALLMTVATVPACKDKEAKKPVAAKPVTPPPKVKEASVAPKQNQEEDAAAKARAEQARLEAEKARAAQAEGRKLARAISFGTDSSNLSDESRKALDDKLAIMRKTPGMRLEILGHCDERGTDAYNYRLGLDRAKAAKRYLVSQGLAPNRIEIRSLGESKPLLGGDGEIAWAKNRRNEFLVVR